MKLQVQTSEYLRIVLLLSCLMICLSLLLQAVENSGTAIALRGKDGVVFAVEKLVTSKLYEKVIMLIHFSAFLNVCRRNVNLSKGHTVWRIHHLHLGIYSFST